MNVLKRSFKQSHWLRLIYFCGEFNLLKSPLKGVCCRPSLLDSVISSEFHQVILPLFPVDHFNS